MTAIFVDGKPYEVDGRQNLLHACLSAGLDIPYFCWHPAMGSVGACRQCAVKQFKDEHDRAGRIVMACMTPVAEGVRISIDDPEAKAFRARVIEWLMANHPHDCPVCDEGGECHLQDMTVMAGHDIRRYRFRKRTFRNQRLGPFLHHEMNRCIQCYRCVRFYRDHAGGEDLHAFSIGHTVYFGRHEDGVLENPFSGNLAEVCPTGVFTDATHRRHYVRKWDEQMAPSVCPHCGTGCNTTPAERQGVLRRILNRYHRGINGYFLCDRGRFGYEYVNDARRIRRPMLQGADKILRPVSREAALRHLAPLLADPSGAIGIGSPRASLESNFALRTLVGEANFFHGMTAAEAGLVAKAIALLREGAARIASVRDLEEADAVLVLGEDLANFAPRAALAARQASFVAPRAKAEALRIPSWQDASVRDVIQDERGPLFVATAAATWLDARAKRTFRGSPSEIARLAFAAAHAAGGGAPAVPGLPEPAASLAGEIATALLHAARPAVVSGTGCMSPEILDAAGSLVRSLHRAGKPPSLLLAVPECNSVGSALLGGGSLEEASGALREGKAETVVVLENDLFRRLGGDAADALLSGARHVVVLDAAETATAARAGCVLPAATLAECDGTLVNHEGRAQRFFQVMTPQEHVQAGWRWMRDVAGAAGIVAMRDWSRLDDVVAALAAALPHLSPVAQAAPPADFRVLGARIQRQPPRWSGRTAVHADRDVKEGQAAQDLDSPLAFSMEGYAGTPPPALVPWFWAPRWNSNQAVNKYQKEIAGELRGESPPAYLLVPGTPGATFPLPPGPHETRPGEWVLVPLYDIFGSEERARQAPAVASRVPPARILLHPEDAAVLGAEEGDRLTVSADGREFSLPLRIGDGVPRGVAGIPAGFPETAGIRLPVPGRLRKGGGP